MSYTINSHALTGEKPCINKGFLVPFKHRKLTFNMIVPGPLKLFRHTFFNCHNTIHWWCNRPIKMDPFNNNKKKKKKKKKKEDARPGFEPYFSGWGSATLFITLESRLYCNAVRLHLIPITTTLLSINCVINLWIRHRVVKQNWKQCCLHIFTMSKWE